MELQNLCYVNLPGNTNAAKGPALCPSTQPYTCVCVSTHVEARSQIHIFLKILPLFLSCIEAGLPTGPELTGLTRVSSQLSPGIPPVSVSLAFRF